VGGESQGESKSETRRSNVKGWRGGREDQELRSRVKIYNLDGSQHTYHARTLAHCNIFDTSLVKRESLEQKIVLWIVDVIRELCQCYEYFCDVTRRKSCLLVFVSAVVAVVCYLLSVVCCLLSVVCCQLSGAFHLMRSALHLFDSVRRDWDQDPISIYNKSFSHPLPGMVNSRNNTVWL
jgi:hypothetical protein